MEVGPPIMIIYSLKYEVISIAPTHYSRGFDSHVFTLHDLSNVDKSCIKYVIKSPGQILSPRIVEARPK